MWKLIKEFIKETIRANKIEIRETIETIRKNKKLLLALIIGIQILNFGLHHLLDWLISDDV